jgi:hypothetical protein
MKFLISFIRIDATISEGHLLNGSALSCICHEYVTTETPDFQDCSNRAKSKQPSKPRRIMLRMVKVCFALKQK